MEPVSLYTIKDKHTSIRKLRGKTKAEQIKGKHFVSIYTMNLQKTDI